MGVEEFKVALLVANFVMLIAHAAYTYLGNQDKVTTTRLSEMEKRLTEKNDEYGQRLSALESDIAGAPTHKDLSSLYDSINRIAETVNQLVGETKLQSDFLRMMMSNQMQRRQEHNT